MSNWISVKDRLPEDKEYVIVKGGEVYRVYYRALGSWVALEKSYFKSIEITHWISLPKQINE